MDILYQSLNLIFSFDEDLYEIILLSLKVSIVALIISTIIEITWLQPLLGNQIIGQITQTMVLTLYYQETVEEDTEELCKNKLL